jgi:hypothetical protein
MLLDESNITCTRGLVVANEAAIHPKTATDYITWSEMRSFLKIYVNFVNPSPKDGIERNTKLHAALPKAVLQSPT